jgi:hypothetical protein
MTDYTIVLARMMTQVHHVEADDIKSAVEQAMDQETLCPDSGNDFDAAGETEVQVVEKDGVQVWDSTTGDESELFD